MSDTFQLKPNSPGSSGVEEACRAFASAWKAGQPIGIEAALAGVSAAERSTVLRRLLPLELSGRTQRGDSVQVAEYQARFPQEADWIAQLFSENNQPTHNVPPEAETQSHLYSPSPGGEPALTLADPPHTPHTPPPFLPGGEGTVVPSAEDWPKVAGYELLEILGRGGMGVVYKARQLNLNRLVALKMILSGEHAGPEDRVRFLNEAEAVARLQHPNIVQIYEVGRRGDLPYFALEYVEGGNLAQYLRGRPQPPTEAAALVEKLARTIHYAHQRDVIHRDLKPANILLSGEWREASDEKTPPGAAPWPASPSMPLAPVPKITDFGLAKRIEGGHGLTQTGQVLGTPAYMAPEQAGGKTKEIGPLSDVYALGVILYEMLTGQPPFKTGNFHETLQQVLNADPTSLSRLQPGIPADLDTICLKALAKEPHRRYSSALMLAQDLERFLAGEPILARREGLVRKVVRKVRRKPLAVGMAVMAAAAMIVAGVLLWSGIGNRRIAELHRQVDPAMDLEAWDAADKKQGVDKHLEHIEGLLAELEDLAPAESAAQRQRLHQRLSEWIGRQIRQPALAPEQVARIENFLRLLSVRDAVAAAGLDKTFQLRLLQWEKVFALTPPFLERDVVFDLGTVEISGPTLQRQKETGKSAWIDPVLLTRFPCQGNVELEAEFDAGWEAVPEVGLWLNARPPKEKSATRSGYAFLLLSPAKAKHHRPGDEIDPRLRLQILRDDLLLQEHVVKVGPGPLRMRVLREANRLTFQINQLPAVVFQEVFPLPGSDPGVFAVHWPAKVKLRQLQARRQAVPQAPSPLEKGDDHFARGQVKEALEDYRLQAIAADPTSAVGQEARYKQGICLVADNRADEAVIVFNTLIAENDKRWAPLSLCQLWLLRLQQERYNDAESLFQRLSGHYTFSELGSLIPEVDRERILKHYGLMARGVNFYRPDPNRIPVLKRGADAEKYLRGPGSSNLDINWQLFRAYHSQGMIADAFDLGGSILGNPHPDHSRLQGIGKERWIEDYCWLLRLRGEAKTALALIEPWLFAKPGVYHNKAVHVLLLERARVQAALQNWKAAEHDVEEYFRLVPRQHRPFHHSGACLLRGWLRQKHMDLDGAREAWREGSLPDDQLNTFWGLEWLSHVMVGGLTNDMTNAQSKKLFNDLIMAMADQEGVKVFIQRVPIPPGLMRDMWRSPRGRDFTQKFALRSISLAELVRGPPVLMGYEVVYKGAFQAKPSAEQDELLFKLANAFYDGYLQKKLTVPQILFLGSTWEGYTNFLGWASIKNKIDSDLRGPIAYVMGIRYLKLDYPKDALTFFETARADAPPNSTLLRLAEAEIKRLKK